jgi:methylenetetrahydrofolate reductase (NADPH)
MAGAKSRWVKIFMTKTQISFEFFPPKTSIGFTKLNDVAKTLTQFAPAFFSVTYGAGGSTRDGTIETIKQLQQATNIVITPHLSCIGSSKTELLKVLSTYQALGAKQIIVLRGDLPSGMGQTGDFKYARELVELIRRETADHFHIKVAAYPECHPQTNDLTKELLHFKAKVEAGADSAITQYFYDPDAYFCFLEGCTKLGVSIPIVPGIMPITDAEKLLRFSSACGAKIPVWLRNGLETYGNDEQALNEFGAEVVYKLCERLLRGGAPGLHFYTLNKAEASATLYQMLRELI